MQKSILIVEDEDLIRGLCVDVFRDSDYEVAEAVNGDEALSLLRSGLTVSAIVSDIRMPGSTDGMALRREVERSWPDIKMLLTSGHIYVERAELSDKQVFLSKPFHFLDLVRHVDELIAENY